MNNNLILKRYKKRVIKWENVIISVYSVITLFKYFITTNSNILTLLYDLTIDFAIGLFIYYTISILRKESI